MRASILSLFFSLFSFCLFAQNENPYKEFGYEAPIMPDKEKSLSKQIDHFIIIDADSASAIGFVLINTQKRNVAVFDRKGLILRIDTLDAYSTARWLTVDPKSQFSSPYTGMGNNPISGTDPDGGYSKFGATWRNFFSGGSGVYQSGEDGGRAVFGFNKDGIAHFGEDARSFWKSFDTSLNDDIMRRANEVAIAQLGIPSSFVTGNAIQPDYTIESFAIPFFKGAGLIYNGTIRGTLKTTLGASRLGGSAAKLNYYTLKAIEMGYSTSLTGAKVKAGIFVQINHNIARIMQGRATTTLYSNNAATIAGRELQNQAIGSGLLGVGAGTGSLYYNLNGYFDK
jgi:hypothetical protein